jgi:hypothetical protein
MTSSEPAQETHNYSQCDPIRIEPPLKLPSKSKAKQSRAKPNEGILKLPIQDLKDTDNMALSTHGPGLEQRQLRAKQVPLLLHFKLDDAGLAAQAQHLADAGARRGVAVRRRVARQGTEGRCRRRGDAAGGARGAEGGAQAVQRGGCAAQRGEGLEAVLALGGGHFRSGWLVGWWG